MAAKGLPYPGEVLGILEQEGHFDDVVQRHPSGLKSALQVLEALLGLGLDAFRPVARFIIVATVVGGKDKVPGDNTRGESEAPVRVT